MDFQQLHLQENETTEFKTSFSDEVVIALTAFANTKGGRVCIGVKDNGNIQGITIGKETIQQWLTNKDQPTTTNKNEQTKLALYQRS